MIIERDELEEVANAADIALSSDDAGDGPYLYANYSGRFMYGENCIGVVGTPGQATRFILALSETMFSDEIYAILDSQRQDSMGLDTITYWTDLSVAE